MKKIILLLALIAGSALFANAAQILTDDFSSTNAWSIDVNADSAGGDLSITSDGGMLFVHEVASAAGDDNLGTITRTIDTTGFEAITLSLFAKQGALAGSFEGGEYLDISIDTGSGFVSVFNDYGVLDLDSPEAGTGTANKTGITISNLDLGVLADNGSFDLRISFNTGFWSGTAVSEEYYLDDLSINGTDMSAPPAVTNLLVNSDFEASLFSDGWNAVGVVEAGGLNGTASSAKLGYNTTATLGQDIAPLSNFTLDGFVEVAGNTTEDSFHILLDTAGGTAIEVRGGVGNAIQINDNGRYTELTSISGGTAFTFPGDTTVGDDAVFFRIAGRDFGTTNANYDIAWSESGSTNLTHAAINLTAFVSPVAACAGGFSGLRFDRSGPSGHSYWVDELSLTNALKAVPAADFEYIAPAPDKVVEISGIYPHLAMSNAEFSEVGVGAVVPWANRLWAITYTGHAPYGSSDKLWEITPELDIIARPESIGGTPANRFIHTASQQLNIGPYFIDTNRTVRVLPYSSAPGRPTATAAHLTDPDNRLYIMTMEDGVYDVNVHDLSFITRYPDVQGKGDRFLHGYHGKGLYSGQGQLVAANNGRPTNFSYPTGETGVLATWDGTTVAENGGSYFAENDDNTGIGDNTGDPVAAQPDYIAGWKQHYKVQHCEVTGPGGIYGSSDPENDPIWATGFDDKSVVVRVMEDGATWNTWRLPKGSYSHDGSHGWHTEWPRIRQLDPSDPDSIYLMHMHGLFFDFPKTFSSTNFAGLSPICSYYKMPTDYCMFNGRLVMGKDDASLFANPLTLRTQSNLWFGQLDDLYSWGSAHGLGSLWKYEDVAADTFSEPFLVNGFSRITLHLKHDTAQPVDIEIQTGNGDGAWASNRTVTVAAGGYRAELLNDMGVEWIRLKPTSSAASLTACLLLSNPYPHITPAGLGTSEFSALANIGDAAAYSDGLLRVMADADLRMEIATAQADEAGSFSESGYHVIGGSMLLDATVDATAEADLRADAEPTKDFDGDDASVWITDDVSGVRLRLPRLDPAYDAEFPSGWARGFREVVTERSLFNCQGTFYEVPRENSGGRYRMRPITTHGKRISDFTAWRGLLVMTGVRDDAPESDRLVRNAEGAAIWLGEVDDLWEMGEPRGYGGPWLDTSVTSNVPSDAYLIYGYDKKELTLSHASASAVQFTVQVDFLADGTWSTFETFTVPPGETLEYTFPEGFRAQWVRVVSDTTTTATARFVYSSSSTASKVALSVEPRANSVVLGAVNLPTDSAISNILQSTDDLGSGWSDLFAIQGVTETNFEFQTDAPSEFYRIKSTY